VRELDPGATALRTIASLLATWLLWGSAYLAIKIALPDFPPFFQMGTRFVAAGTLLLLWVGVHAGGWPTRTEWRDSVVIGVLLLVGGAGGTAYAEQTIPSGLVAGFIAVEPALIVIGGLALGRRSSWLETIGVFLGFCGVVLLVRGRGFSASPAGALVMLAATISWSAGSLLAQRKFASGVPAAGTACQMICGGSALLIVSALVGEPLHLPSTLPAMLAWLYLVVFGSVVAYSGFIYLLAHTRTTVAMSYTFVNPFVALVLGVAFGGEQIGLGECFAIGVIATGVVLLFMNTSPRNSRRHI